MMNIVGNRYAFDVTKAVGASMHPASIVRFHFESIDEMIFELIGC